MKTFGVILLILFCVIILIGVYSSQESSVYDWAKSKGYKVEKIESHLTPFGTPFYYLHKGNYIFEVWVITQDGNREHWWIRKNGLFSDDYEKD